MYNCEMCKDKKTVQGPEGETKCPNCQRAGLPQVKLGVPVCQQGVLLTKEAIDASYKRKWLDAVKMYEKLEVELQTVKTERDNLQIQLGEKIEECIRLQDNLDELFNNM